MHKRAGSLVAFPKALAMLAFRPVLHCRLVTDGLRIEGHRSRNSGAITRFWKTTSVTSRHANPEPAKFCSYIVDDDAGWPVWDWPFGSIPIRLRRTSVFSTL